MTTNDLDVKRRVLINLAKIHLSPASDLWYAVTRYIYASGKRVQDLEMAIAEYEQNERAYTIREKELLEQNTRLIIVSKPSRLRQDLRDLEAKVIKQGQDIQALMNPVEIVDNIVDATFDESRCKCASCKWEQYVAGKKS